MKRHDLGILLSLALTLGLMAGMGMAAHAQEHTFPLGVNDVQVTEQNRGDGTVSATPASTYILTIPSTLNVANIGWNPAHISVKGRLVGTERLYVTASSEGEFALVSGRNKILYKLAENGDEGTTYDGTVEKTAWEFATLSDTEAITRPVGIVVEDYTEKPGGNTPTQ